MIIIVTFEPNCLSVVINFASATILLQKNGRPSNCNNSGGIDNSRILVVVAQHLLRTVLNALLLLGLLETSLGLCRRRPKAFKNEKCLEPMAAAPRDAAERLRAAGYLPQIGARRLLGNDNNLLVAASQDHLNL